MQLTMWFGLSPHSHTYLTLTHRAVPPLQHFLSFHSIFVKTQHEGRLYLCSVLTSTQIRTPLLVSVYTIMEKTCLQTQSFCQNRTSVAQLCHTQCCNVSGSKNKGNVNTTTIFFCEEFYFFLRWTLQVFRVCSHTSVRNINLLVVIQITGLCKALYQDAEIY